MGVSIEYIPNSSIWLQWSLFETFRYSVILNMDNIYPKTIPLQMIYFTHSTCDIIVRQPNCLSGCGFKAVGRLQAANICLLQSPAEGLLLCLLSGKGSVLFRVVTANKGSHMSTLASSVTSIMLIGADVKDRR